MNDGTEKNKHVFHATIGLGDFFMTIHTDKLDYFNYHIEFYHMDSS